MQARRREVPLHHDHGDGSVRAGPTAVDSDARSGGGPLHEGTGAAGFRALQEVAHDTLGHSRAFRQGWALGQKPSPVSPTGALLPLSAGSSAPFGLNASHLGKAVPFKRHDWPFRPGLFGLRGPGGLFCFETGNQFRDREPIRDREPFRDGEPRSRRGPLRDWEPSLRQRQRGHLQSIPAAAQNREELHHTECQRQREPKGNANKKATGTKFWGKGTIPFPLHQPPFSSPCFLGCLKSALVVTPKAICSAQRLTYPTRG